MKIKDRDDFIESMVDHIVDGMEIAALIAFSKEMLADSYSSCTDADLLELASNFAPHLLDANEEV